MKNYNFVYGIPRGGSYISVGLAQMGKMSLCDGENINAINNVLIVDDIIDSGATRLTRTILTYLSFAEKLLTCIARAPNDTI